MKTFFLKVFLLSVIVGSLLYTGGFAYRQTTTYQNLERTEDTEKFHQIPDTIQVAVFGSSHGRDAFPFFEEEDSFFNFSLSSQTPQYDEKMMLQYGKRFDSEALVILTVSYLSPFWTDSQTQFDSKQPRYYRTLDAKNIVDIDFISYCLQRFSPLLTEDIDKVLSAFLKKVPLKENSIEQAFYHRTTAEKMESEQARIKKNHLSTIEPTFPAPVSSQMEAYRSMLTMCQENGWTAVLVTPPYLKEYTDCFPDDFLPIFYEQVNLLATEFDVPYLDYSHDSTYTTNYDLFKNIDHLNYYGATQFGQQFMTDLQHLSIL